MSSAFFLPLVFESACYQNKMRMLGGHLTDALAVRMWEWTCLIEMATLVAPSAIMPDLPAESGFQSVSFLSLLRRFDFGHGLVVSSGHIQGPSRQPFQHQVGIVKNVVVGWSILHRIELAAQ